MGMQLVAAVAAGVAILLVGWVTQLTVGGDGAVFLIASMGASAVLLFCLHDSPYARTWPFVGGHLVAVAVGVSAARLVPSVPMAAAVAVGGAIVAMVLLRCLHPPGGAAALTAVVGGPDIQQLGYQLLLTPLLLNLFMMWLLVTAYHRLIQRLRHTN